MKNPYVDTVEGNTQFALLAAWQTDPAMAARWLQQWPAKDRGCLASYLASWALQGAASRESQLQMARGFWGDN